MCAQNAPEMHIGNGLVYLVGGFHALLFILLSAVG